METLKEIAAKILHNRNSIEVEKQQRERKQYEDHKQILMIEFEAAFAEVLPLLKQEGIQYSAHRQDPKYPHQGTYILFKKDGQEAKMDFNSRNKYRYEFVPEKSGRTGSMTYGVWPMEDFILFLHKELYT